MPETAGQIDTVRAFMRRVNANDLSGALAMLHEDVVVHEPSGLPYGGSWHGHEGFRRLLTDGVGATWRRWRERDNRYADLGGAVIRETVFTARLRGNGRAIEMPFIELFEFRAGRIALIRPFYWDGALISAALELGPGDGDAH